MGRTCCSTCGTQYELSTEPIGGEEFGIGDEAEADDYLEYIAENENVVSKPLFEKNYVEAQEALPDGGPLLEDLTKLEELANTAPSGRALQGLTAEQLDQLEEKVFEVETPETPWKFQEELDVDDAYEYEAMNMNATGNEAGPMDIEMTEFSAPEVPNPLSEDIIHEMDITGGSVVGRVERTSWVGGSRRTNGGAAGRGGGWVGKHGRNARYGSGYCRGRV